MSGPKDLQRIVYLGAGYSLCW